MGGKTTTTINLGAALAEKNLHVLVVDLDPQGNSSTGLGIEPTDRQYTAYELLLDDVPMEDVILRTEQPNLDLIPATVDLSSADIELVANEKRSFLLREALRQAAMNAMNYDYI